ncbi:holliday junction DNA helicase RuvB [Microcystis aeruginosa NIES-3806]|uniref:Holliday junction branch migration complex subunit RuvB n=3 Tax=Microcystis aeruginosa TaxID=1126 RepID=A0A0F6RKF1_MICAE|nr:Holliday junction branch migration DNA helicase RuvB [Microcystis aeruginosa]AKE63443.1 Holliday junction DNA helicase RuvB [Microcystis aeruginosa NIES-2549]AOC51839.1 Holliday junction DNA helicase RuvB [Microcystis aeruginosa NIES-2481]GCL45024.1 holliday junction DNA helicase RuvB [Microcystis aeruginosa NIES-3787]GCL55170.1 holliday junction DNA helicase RuvB [Microcystis aeruginosa NIES-3806]GCL57750.1 holliday junction DNA helicase RuvB [Microcystis aeruginosa NIES-3807]
MAIKRSHNSPPAAEENLLTANPTIEETEKAEAQIRPQSLEDYIGQQDLKANLKVTIAAAKARQEAIDHLLFYGPPGLGKTTMALILAAEMGVNCRITAAPALERPRDITGILINLKPRDILFIDEIHRLNRVTEELLYPAMEDYRLDVTIGKGQAAKIRSISLPPFTLIGATTKVGSLTSPLRDRFGMIQRLRFYTVEELTTIILRSATIFNIPMTEAGAIEISRRSRGTPRIANRLLKRVRDYVQVKGETMITPQLAAEGLNQLNVDSMGLDWTDRLVLKTMIEQFQGRPVGLEAVAAATGEDAKTIEEVYEPYLLQIGYLNRTARGRVVTAAAYEHLGLLAKLPKNKDQSLPLFEL